MAGGAEHQFIAWTRTGLGALLDGGGKVVELDLGSSGSVSRTITQYGPGHVVGLDPRSVSRTVPSNGAPDFEPNLFPSIEFSHPALPWLLSPSGDPPTPWIALVVVEVTAGVTLAAVGGKLVLTIDAPARPHDQLPDLSQAWAWAHGQITGAEGDPIDTAALRSTGIGRSRLIAPRHLEASKSYYACVVPTFAEGVAAALATPSATGLAWTGSETTVRLPVYTSWQFSTASEGDFASLVKRVQPESLDVSVGHRGVDISEPGWGGAASPGAVLEVAGALYSPAWTQPTLDAASAALGASIAVELDAGASPTPHVPPTFAPPFYGSAATHTEAVAAAPSWQRALNTDIRQRIAAGIGSQVVRANLDRFVEAAWTAIGDSESINHLIRHAELAGAITQRIADKHLSTVTASGELFAIARPLLARVRSSTSATLAAVVIASSMPTAALSASFRRLGRPAGTLARTTTKSGVLLERINARTIVPVPDKVLASGAASFDQVSIATNSVARLASATPDALTRAATGWKLATTTSSPSLEPQLPAIARAPVTPPAVDTTTRAVARGVLPVGERGTIRLPSDVKPTNVQVDAFAAAARRHQLYIMQRLSRISDRPAPFPQLDAVRSQLALQWTPERGIIPVVSSRISGIDVQATSTFTPVTVKPVLAQPLIQSLQALSPQLVMPGVSNVLPNRMAIAAVNPEFVRGLLVGANEELARELLWRRYPAALGHTWLQTFWGCVRPGPDGQPVDVPDIPPIETWLDTAPVAGPGQLALLIRGDVLHRYPNALVYAVSAAWQGNYRVIGDGAPLLPTIATTLGGDIALFGFDLDVAVAKGGTAQPASAGWYFVIGEHPHEPRFGLAATSTQPLTRWGDVAWSDLAATDLGGNYLRIDGPLAARTFQTSPLRWGADAAQIASITFRRVSRVAIHASRLL